MIFLLLIILTGCSDSNIRTDDVQNDYDSGKSQIIVNIVGEVKNPGIITIDDNSRLYEVIEKAGGLTENADKNSVNMARYVKDGEHILIPSVVESQNDSRVNLNTATQKELETVKGIGPAKARDIIIYREKNGVFSSIDDLKKISGIKEAFIDKIREYVKVE